MDIEEVEVAQQWINTSFANIQIFSEFSSCLVQKNCGELVPNLTSAGIWIGITSRKLHCFFKINLAPDPRKFTITDAEKKDQWKYEKILEMNISYAERLTGKP